MAASGSSASQCSVPAIAARRSAVATLFGETRTEGYDAERGYSVVKLEGTVVFVVPEGTRWFYFAAANCLDTCHPDTHPNNNGHSPRHHLYGTHPDTDPNNNPDTYPDAHLD